MKKALILLLVFLAAMALMRPKEQEAKVNPARPEAKREEPAFRKNLLELHNKERFRWGCKPLEIDQGLCEYAQKHAEKMANDNRLVHSSMSELQKAIDSSSVGENIAWGQETEADVVSAWMWSPGHRWNILGSDYGRAGFGMKKDDEGRIYWCVVFSD
jgi:uncharacterized protein YkwD